MVYNVVGTERVNLKKKSLVLTTIDVIEDFEKSLSASLNFLFLLSALAFVDL